MGNTYTEVEPWMLGKVVTVTAFRLGDSLLVGTTLGTLRGYAESIVDEVGTIVLDEGNTITLDINHYFELEVHG